MYIVCSTTIEFQKVTVATTKYQNLVFKFIEGSKHVDVVLLYIKHKIRKNNLLIFDLLVIFGTVVTSVTVRFLMAVVAMIAICNII